MDPQRVAEGKKKKKNRRKEGKKDGDVLEAAIENAVVQSPRDDGDEKEEDQAEPEAKKAKTAMASGVQDGLVHVRIQQRNKGKTLTTIQGLSAEYNLKKMVRACKKVWLC